MGCTQAKPKSLQQKLIDQDSRLLFDQLTILKIKQTFGPLYEAKETINFRQFRNALSELGIQYSLGDDRMVRRFLSTFFDHEDESVINYDLKKLLVVIYLLAQDTQENKAAALFDLYDENDKGLKKRQIEQAIREIIELVQAYTKNLLEVNSSSIRLQERISKAKREELLPQVVNWFTPGQENLTKDKFLEEVKKTAKSRGFIDFTSPQSIRNAFMSFAVQPKETNIELQMMPSLSLYSSRISSARESEVGGRRESLNFDFDAHTAGYGV